MLRTPFHSFSPLGPAPLGVYPGLPIPSVGHEQRQVPLPAVCGFLHCDNHLVAQYCRRYYRPVGNTV